MLHPTQAVTLSRDFKAQAEQIDNIYETEKFSQLSPHVVMICGNIQTNLKC